MPCRLLDAVIAMAGNLELSAVLDMIVNSARRLTGASYAALGVLEEDPAPGERFLSEFHHLEIPTDYAARLGDPPRPGVWVS